MLCACLLAMSHSGKERCYEREASIHFEEELGVGVKRSQVSKDTDKVGESCVYTR